MNKYLTEENQRIYYLREIKSYHIMRNVETLHYQIEINAEDLKKSVIKSVIC